MLAFQKSIGHRRSVDDSPVGYMNSVVAIWLLGPMASVYGPRIGGRDWSSGEIVDSCALAVGEERWKNRRWLARTMRKLHI